MAPARWARRCYAALLGRDVGLQSFMGRTSDEWRRLELTFFV